jgi:hypothetical protein
VEFRDVRGVGEGGGRRAETRRISLGMLRAKPGKLILPPSLPHLSPALQLNPDVNAFQRSFIGEIRRLDEMERKLRFLTTQTEKAGGNIYITPLEELSTTQMAFLARPRSQQEIEELDALLTEYDTKLLQLNASQESLHKRFLELSELKHVLRETAGFFELVGATGSWM